MSDELEEGEIGALNRYRRRAGVSFDCSESFAGEMA